MQPQVIYFDFGQNRVHSLQQFLGFFASVGLRGGGGLTSQPPRLTPKHE